VVDAKRTAEQRIRDEGKSAGCQVEIVRSTAWADIDSWLDDQIQAPSPAMSVRAGLEGTWESKGESNCINDSQVPFYYDLTYAPATRRRLSVNYRSTCHSKSCR
jgi:hypothetical protein